jgi:DNA-binding PadR family transcriptional regulator
MLYIVLHMSDPTTAALETAVLLAVAQLGDEAYGAAVRRDVSERRGHDYAVGAIHTALQRLEDKGMLVSRTGDPLPIRGGRARRYFQLTGLGAQALERARLAAQRMWQSSDLGLEPS